MSNSIVLALTQLLPARRRTNATTGWTSFNAVCCSHNGESVDTRGRGGVIVNPDGAVSYSCFNCNFRASYQPGRHLTYKFRKLLTWLGADENTVKRLVIEAIRIRELTAPDERAVVESAEPINFKPRPLPESAQTFSAWESWYTLKDSAVPEEFHAAVIYSATRRIDLIKYNLMWTPTTHNNLHRRVIVPFTWQNEVIGYTARAFDDTVKPKYYNSHEPGYVFNVDQQQAGSKFVIVCEGPFDAMAIDGVAVLGNEVSEQQADIIDSLAREVIVVPDADRAGSRLVDAAVEYGWSVSYPEWQRECKDIGAAVEQYGKLFVLKSILAGKETGRLKIELLKKRLYN